MKNRFIISLVLLCALTGACSTPPKDMEYPEILPLGEETSPANCQIFSRGGVLPFNYAFSDNLELGSFNIDIHNNFKHHTHGTEAEECEQDPEKEAVNPWIFNKDYPIPGGKAYYESSFMIDIPENVDPGEYHLMIRLTDSAGWQQLKSLSIRIK